MEFGWDMILEEENELVPDEDDRRFLNRYDDDLEVLEVEGGENAYAESGVLSSTGVKECIALGYVTDDSAAMFHFLADSMNSEELSSEMLKAFHHLEDLESDGTWQVIGGYSGEPEYGAESSIELSDVDEAMARRNRVTGMLDDRGEDYNIEWIDGDEIKFLYADVDRGRLITATDNPESNDNDQEYLW